MYIAVRRFGKLGIRPAEGGVSWPVMALIVSTARGGTCGVLQESAEVDRGYKQLTI
jgi:hypothetical protein